MKSIFHNCFTHAQVLAVALGLMLSGSVSTTLAQAELRVWSGAGAGELASTPANWVANTPPDPGDSVLFTNSAENCAWDLDIALQNWTQAADYSGTVTVQTRFPGQGSFTNLTIIGNVLLDGGRWTHPANSGGAAAVDRLAVSIGGNLTVGSNAAINVSEKGYNNGQGPGAGGNNQRTQGPSHGGMGGPHTAAQNPRPTYGCPFAPLTLGSGGGGRGGGGARLNVGDTTRIDGFVSATGEQGSWRRPGGAGGSIFLTTASLEGKGSIVAAGRGASDSTDSGGSGGGGRIAVVLTGSSDFGNITIDAPAGKDNSSSVGASGTVYLQIQDQSKGEGTLIIDNDPHTLSTVILVATMMPEPSDYNDAPDLSNLAAIIVTNNARLGFDTQTIYDFGAGNLLTYGPSESTIILSGNNTGLNFPDPFVVPDSYTLMINGPLNAIGDWTVPAGVTLSHFWNRIAQTYWLELTLDGDLTIEAGAAIDANGRGYAPGQGPGAGPTGGYREGGSHGGMGGLGYGGQIAQPTYGPVVQPATLGSGAVFAGGGMILLDIQGELILDGTLAARNAASSAGRGGPAGGSIRVRAREITGNGLIDVSGGPTSFRGSAGYGSAGGGGGGRTALVLTDSDSFGGVQIKAPGGPNTTPAYSFDSGAAGTIYTETHSQGTGHGQLLIANDNRDMDAVTNTLTWLPAPGSGFGDELRDVTLVISNQAHVALSSDLTIGDLYIRQDTPNFLYLKGHTLKVLSMYHADWGSMEDNVIADGGRIEWLRGTLIRIR